MPLLTTFVTFISPLVVPWGVALSGVLLRELVIPGPMGHCILTHLLYGGQHYPGLLLLFFFISPYINLWASLDSLSYFYLSSFKIFVTFFCYVRPVIC
jgi:hypothetical protein